MGWWPAPYPGLTPLHIPASMEMSMTDPNPFRSVVEKFICDFNMQLYPFDTQRCYMLFELAVRRL